MTSVARVMPKIRLPEIPLPVRPQDTSVLDLAARAETGDSRIVSDAPEVLMIPAILSTESLECAGAKGSSAVANSWMVEKRFLASFSRQRNMTAWSAFGASGRSVLSGVG